MKTTNETTNTQNETSNYYYVQNLITGEVKGECRAYTLAGAQEYFDIMLPNMTNFDMLYEKQYN